MNEDKWEQIEEEADARRERLDAAREISSFMDSEEGEKYLNDVGQAYAVVWAHLSKVDVTVHVQQRKGYGDKKLDYISWASCWGFLMEFYPDFRREFGPNEVHPDGSVFVHCTLWIRTNSMVLSQSERLPVTDNSNNAVVNPDCDLINTAQQRCFVKCAALFGLGHRLYLGKEVRDRLDKAEGKEVPQQPEPKAAPKPEKPKAVPPKAQPKPKPAPTPEAVSEPELDGHPVAPALTDEDKTNMVASLINMARATCQTPASLIDFWNTNKGDINLLDQKSPEFKQLVEGFTKLKEVLAIAKPQKNDFDEGVDNAK